MVEFDFSDPDKPRDWSVVAWGEKGDVHVYHNRHLVSDHLSATHQSRKPVKKPKQPEYDYDKFFAWMAKQEQGW